MYGSVTASCHTRTNAHVLQEHYVTTWHCILILHSHFHSAVQHKLLVLFSSFTHSSWYLRVLSRLLYDLALCSTPLGNEEMSQHISTTAERPAWSVQL